MQQERTLLEMRADIQVRIGFGMAGQAGVVNAPLIDSMLRSAQNQLYEQFDWSALKAVQDRLTGIDQRYYDYPTNCNIERINSISVNWSGQWHPLTEGIDIEDRSFPSSTIPLKFERRDQYELWPVPQAQYAMRVEYVKQLGRFIEDGDRCSLPSEIVFLHALSNAKQHYRQPDAGTYANQLDTMMTRLKARNRRNTTYSRTQGERSPYDYRPNASQMV